MSDIRNKEGIWINSQVFRESASKFIKDGRYCDEVVGTPAYIDYWTMERDRCINGYTVGGATITGDHYFYLNFCPIRRSIPGLVEEEKTSKRKKGGNRKDVTFPDFWDGDYNYYHIVDIARSGGIQEEVDSLLLDVKIKDLSGDKHIIIGKARRKGFSYKNGSKAAAQYALYRNSYTLITASDKKYLFPSGTMTMAYNYINFLNENTAFASRTLINKQDHIKSGYIATQDGISIEKGMKSQILSLTMADNPDAARGKDADLFIMEEVGDWPNWKNALAASLPCVQDGDAVTGQLIAFGTGGNSGSSLDFSEVYYNPEPYGFLAFDNIWDPGMSHTTCGHFFPVEQNYISKEGAFIDLQGNSLKDLARTRINEKREEKKKSAKDSTILTKFCIENPFCPSEAFGVIEGNTFPIAELREQLRFIESSVSDLVQGTPGNLVIDVNGKVKFEPLLKSVSQVQIDFPVKSDDTEGTVIIWAHPNPKLNYAYVGGNDPYGVDQTSTSPSMGATYIIERASVTQTDGSNHDRIVAEWVGRPKTFKEYNEVVRKLLMYYNNAICLYENNINNLKEYFDTKNCLYLLAKKPSIITSNANSTVTSVYGQRMTEGVKKELVGYLDNWLKEEIGEGKMNLHSIYSKPLIRELIAYNSKGNFDRVIALMMAIAQKLQTQKILVSQKQDKVIDPFFKRKLFINNRNGD